MLNDVDSLARIAQTIELPDWATHVAVSKVRDNYAEPCAWVESCRDYVDEDPTSLAQNAWAGGYKNVYWHFFSRDDVVCFQQKRATVQTVAAIQSH